MNSAAAPAAGPARFTVAPGGTLGGALRVPGDKSISHRALILGALADGTSEISGILDGADCRATAAALGALGAHIGWPAGGAATVHGPGLAGLQPTAAPLDLGNSGTGLRLLAGVAAGQPFTTVLTGDASLRRRPMRRIAEPLRQMGATIEATPGELAPLRIAGRRPLAGLRYRLPVASAQLKSALLLAGLFADSDTACQEPAVTRDHTERLLTQFGADIFRDGAWIGLRAGARLRASAVAVPGDFSSAAFFIVAATIASGSDLWLEGIGLNPTRTGALDILRAMGARINIENPRVAGGEPVADVRVRSASLKGIAIPPALVPLAIDEFPALMIAAACADGVTTLTGAAELRVKESDRIATLANGLEALGVPVEVAPDGLRVEGIDEFRGAAVHSGGDHRIAMAFALAALRAKAPVEVLDTANVATSFPGFAALAAAAGLAIREERP
ncbi:MAG TPA: 3-phosphoshikimate 1-carboxyvinyltransferase [Gammaproteobacteria bacterium]|nr:3-phosphoshikimate 1-carboxyvinyltransferase [Gammaproteobacteria bacterium]